ncbi:uncharacterized protein LOC113778380 [Coffea eugenioides]|uniref:uncharacterized protein LOC113778380 n=1 Tax=Coffea eugenioides TaxID=49369 RepID=UPI000F6125E7|nr:uncharacterized protein LOC113778380 [Coffea eugenioides]
MSQRRGKTSSWTVFDLTTSASVQPLDTKMSRRRGKTSGCTAFDLEHRRKQRLEPEARDEFFPAISSSMEQSQKALTNIANITASEKHFASLLQDAVKFQIKPKRGDMHEKKLQGGCSSGVKDALKANGMLKELHPWADQCLIEDVLAGVDYDVDKASSLLKMMVSSEQKYNNIKITGTDELKFNRKKSLVNENKSLAEKDTDLSQVMRLLEGLVLSNNGDLTDERASSRRMLLHDVFATKMILNSIKSLPIEREEDDVYLAQRKEAQKMTSSASRNSKASVDAYLRGDHLSAQLYSRKAREEWLTAKQLNAKAAKEILRIKNLKNDEWTLDLHGLHAAEAVQALQEHLQRIESQMPTKQLACARRFNAIQSQMPCARIVHLSQMPIACARIVHLSQMPARRFNVMAGIVSSTAPNVAIFRDLEECDSQIPLFRPRPASVEVITGKGKHSRGEATLPPAIRSFLNENRYHYSETRPGVIEVQVKFR